MSWKHEYWEQLEKKLIDEITLSPIKDSLINRVDDHGTSLLHLSCQIGMVHLCRTLLQNNAELNVTDMYKRTPLMIAAYYGYFDVVEVVLSYKPNLDCIDIYGFNAAMHAIYSGDLRIFKLVLPKGNSTMGQTLDTYLGSMSYLELASVLGKLEIVKYLMAEQKDLINHKVEKSGMTPVMLARCGQHKDVSELLEKELGVTGTDAKRHWENGQPKTMLLIPPSENTAVHRRGHPLTPNLYLSPLKKSPKRAFEWIKINMKPKRSRSVDAKKTNSNSNESDPENANLLKSIFQMTKMEQYWPLFKEQEINFKTFLTMNDDDLQFIGISKSSARLKLLNLIDHYRKIFNSN